MNFSSRYPFGRNRIRIVSAGTRMSRVQRQTGQSWWILIASTLRFSTQGTDEYPGVRDDGRILLSGVRGRARAGGRCLDNRRRRVGDRRRAGGGDRGCDL